MSASVQAPASSPTPCRGPQGRWQIALLCSEIRATVSYTVSNHITLSLQHQHFIGSNKSPLRSPTVESNTLLQMVLEEM